MQKKIQRQTKIQYPRVTYEDSEAKKTGMQGAISLCIKKKNQKQNNSQLKYITKSIMEALMRLGNGVSRSQSSWERRQLCIT